MSEPAGTESTGFFDPAPQTPAPAEAPHEFTPDQLEAARQQLIAQGADLGQRDTPVDSAGLGMQALAAGAEPAEVDADALLRMLQAQQSQINALLAEKKLANAPEVVKYATALADHLQARADQNPAIHADPDHTWMPALEQAATLVNAANDAASSGEPGPVMDVVAGLEKWMATHARRFPALDYGYLIDLAGEVAGAAAKLAA